MLSMYAILRVHGTNVFFVWILVWAILFHYFLFLFWAITIIQSQNACVPCVIFGTILLPYGAFEIQTLVDILPSC